MRPPVLTPDFLLRPDIEAPRRDARIKTEPCLGQDPRHLLTFRRVITCRLGGRPARQHYLKWPLGEVQASLKEAVEP